MGVACVIMFAHVTLAPLTEIKLFLNMPKKLSFNFLFIENLKKLFTM